MNTSSEQSHTASLVLLNYYKGIIMSNTKVTNPSAAKVITVSAEQFANAIAGMKTTSVSIKEQLSIACKYIAERTVKAEQDKAKKDLALAYQALQVSLTGKSYKFESATKWVQNNVKKLSGDTKFKWLMSKTAKAAKERAARQTKGAKAEGKTAPAPAPAPKIQTSIEQLRKALIAKEKLIADEYRGVIPAGKIKDFDSAFAAFIQTIELILA
jgi:hypothetical protein